MGLTGPRRDDMTRSAGSLAVAIAAVAFSTAGLFTGLIAADAWTMLFARAVWKASHCRLHRLAGMLGNASGFSRGRVGQSDDRELLDSRNHLLHHRPARDYGRRRHYPLRAPPVIAEVIGWTWTHEYPSRATLAAQGRGCGTAWKLAPMQLR